MQAIKYSQIGLLIFLGAMLSGCIQRTIKLTSDPSGALVYLNDEEVGRTPTTVPYLYYGVYDVRLELKGYKALWTKRKAKAPWWEFPGPDLIAEAIPGSKVQLNWHFELENTPLIEEAELMDRAKQLQSKVRHPQTASTENASTNAKQKAN